MKMKGKEREREREKREESLRDGTGFFGFFGRVGLVASCHISMLYDFITGFYLPFAIYYHTASTCLYFPFSTFLSIF